MAEKKHYWLSFTEEIIMNTDPKYDGYIGGRVEVYDRKSDNPYAEDELRFFTKKQDEFYKFREQWEGKDIDEKTLDWFKLFLEENYHDKI